MAPSRITAAAVLVGAGLVEMLDFVVVGLSVIVSLILGVMEGESVVLVPVECWVEETVLLRLKECVVAVFMVVVFPKNGVEQRLSNCSLYWAATNAGQFCCKQTNNSDK